MGVGVKGLCVQKNLPIVGKALVILFAMNKKFPIYMSPVPNPLAWKGDTFQSPWNYLILFYIYLLSLIQRVSKQVYMSSFHRIAPVA